jgi:F-type H+-transporting ATPase subunit b
MYLLYHVLVHKPLERVLAERRARTEGAIEKARADIAAAEAKAQEYENQLRDAKIAIFRAQEARRQQLLQARTATVAKAKAMADAQVKEARLNLERDVVSAKASLQSEVERLANEIIRTILRSAGSGRAPAAGGQS